MRIMEAIIRCDIARILALENYLASREWRPADPEPGRLKRLIDAERCLMNKHIEQAAAEYRNQVQ